LNRSAPAGCAVNFTLLLDMCAVWCAALELISVGLAVTYTACL
jgi:hypothetical protein